MTHQETREETLVPPRRLGTLLATARSNRGMTLDQVADGSNGRFSKAALSSIERGTADIDDSSLAELAAMYGLATSSLIPERSLLELDVAEGVLRTQIRVEAVGDALTRPDEVLSRYLAMVYSMRHAAPGSKVSLRREDLDVLGTALHLRSDRVETDLEALMAVPDDALVATTSALSRRVLIPAAGVLVAFCSVGALILSAGNTDPDTAPRPAPESTIAPAPAVAPGSGVTADVDVGAGVVQERDAAGGTGPVQQRTGVDEPADDI